MAPATQAALWTLAGVFVGNAIALALDHAAALHALAAAIGWRR